MQPKKVLAEAIGTFALLFAGMLAITNNASLLGVAFAHGLAIAVMAMALGTVSGGQFNPAVSVGLSLSGHQDWATTLAYIPAQLVGAALGAFSALGVAGHDALAKAQWANPALAANVGTGGALLAELIATAFLVLVVVKVAIHQQSVLGGLIVGLTIVMGILAIGPETGAALNPARAFGSALVSGQWANQWVYWVGPILGAVVGALLANFLHDVQPVREPEKVN